MACLLALRDEPAVLINLLENARLAQAVRDACLPCMPGVLSVAEGRADGLATHVVDDGVGIAADTLPRVFEPHFSTPHQRVACSPSAVA